MYHHSLPMLRRIAGLLTGLFLLCQLAACSNPVPAPSSTGQPGLTLPAATSTSGAQVLTFPQTPPQLRTPDFGDPKQIAPTVKVLASVAPSRLIQFPLTPVSIKTLFPKASALVTVLQGDPEVSVFDTVIVDVQNMPPNQKYTFFFTELSAKPFGHAQYVGDVFTRGDGSGESIFHLITFVAFAADNRNPGTSADQTGDASGIQLEHAGIWFDGVNAAREVLNDPTIAGTPFDGGHGALHAGPQAMTDGQTLPVI